ncbi:response regulator [Legionella brunensis]|uniref:Sensory box histidine kinase/response regulator n=1 Tax=Legionella brunensis TaxID=29422 RepID=A0A0W0STN6_9GAMM|nr:response regulator [Legionella brunensis]KTC86643.1 sensory box histidine kinase/response regulator [Legionella brunensis]
MRSVVINTTEITGALPHCPTAPSVLLVEDNPIVLHLIEALTTAAGCQVTAVTTGEQALELVKMKNFDLIITDIGLPGMSGNDLTQFIRKWENDSSKHRHIPIVGLTALPSGQTEKKCLESGMNKVLSKPLQTNTIQELLNNLLPTHHKETVITQESQCKLGLDLPNIEAELFQLEKFLLLDTNKGIENVDSEKILREVLQVLVEKAIPECTLDIQKAYSNKNWEKIAELTHKMKAGTLYCGTERLQYACLYLERYHKAGHSVLLEKLYQQLVGVLKETKLFIEQWLTSDKPTANE